jgi:subtilisin family serine protease
MPSMPRGLVFAVVAALAVLAAAPAAPAAGSRIEVMAELGPPPLARAVTESRALRADVRRARLDLRGPLSTAYLHELAAHQDAVARRIRAAIPAARIRWRYRITFDGLAVTLPARELARLQAVPGVVSVHRSAAYALQETANITAVKVPFLWGSDFSTAGNGVKIGIVDDGVDQTHPYFDSRGFALPAGFPLGQRAYTTPKVIVARSFAPAGSTWKYGHLPFDPEKSGHGTHVAGIAAGDYGTRTATGLSLSGVAPRAYIGNYKVLSSPIVSGGLNGNSPELIAGIEAAVADGMDVINFSIGELEPDPRRDLVARALDAAADAGVVPVIAAGNDYADIGRGSVISPGTAAKAITVGAVDIVNGRPVISWFSSAGPTPLSLRLKPDVTAPGSEILSSVPHRQFAENSGTSMATPHVAGVAALLRQRHPLWTVEQIKSALVTTGVPVRPTASSTAEVPVTREGGGMIDATQADVPLLFASPTNISLALVAPGTTVQRTITLTDAGGGAGAWSAVVQPQTAPPGAAVTVPAGVTVPGQLQLTARVGASASQGEAQGFVVLTRGAVQRRIPYWFLAAKPQLPRDRAIPLRGTGLYRGNTAGLPARVSTYRYPESPGPLGIPVVLNGPEQVFRFRLKRPVANAGVAIVSRDEGVAVTARLVSSGNENKLTGVAGLPVNINPYLDRYETPAPVVGAITPSAGLYDVVFDSRTREGAGRFAFRFWTNDVTPPRLRLLTPVVSSLDFVRIAALDRGAGVDPASVVARVDGNPAVATFEARTRRVLVLVSQQAAGRHTLSLRVSDYQETKNTENIGPVLPNTARLVASFTVR